jgi:hypothetical protein
MQCDRRTARRRPRRIPWAAPRTSGGSIIFGAEPSGLAGLGRGGAGLGGDGASTFGLGQLHGDLGQAGEHLDLLQREAAAKGLDVEIGWCGFHRTYHERRTWVAQ